jgi:hypothetical protein
MRATKILITLDILLFVLVLLVFFLGLMSTTAGLVLLFTWMIVFLLTIIAFNSELSVGSDEWYQYGTMLTTAIMIAIFAGLILSFDIYGVALLIPFSLMGTFVINWFFTDKSEHAMEKDLEKLRGELN